MPQPEPRPAPPTLVHATPLTRRLADEVARLATTPRSTISIVGEVGVGKQAWARRLHAESARRELPFVVVPPVADPDGAPSLTPERIARAAGGTLYLRDVTRLAPDDHAALAELFASGDPETPRVVAAAREPLEQAAADGRLPEDLEYRLNVLTLEVAPLRERLGELGDLAQHFAARHAALLDVPLPEPGVTPQAVAALAERDWPGNLHQLSWTLRGALVGRLAGPKWASSDPLEAHELPPSGQNGGSEPPTAAGGSLEELEEVAVRRALEEHGGNRSRAARALGIHRTTLYQKMRRYGLR